MPAAILKSIYYCAAVGFSCVREDSSTTSAIVQSIIEGSLRSLIPRICNAMPAIARIKTYHEPDPINQLLPLVTMGFLLADKPRPNNFALWYIICWEIGISCVTRHSLVAFSV